MANILIKMLLDATGYERGLQGAAGKTKAFEQAAATVTGTIGKIAGAFGLAIGGAEAFQKVIRGSQTTSDEYDRVVRSMKTSVDEFFSAISLGDFSRFSLGLDDIISKARAANDALDQLGNTTMSYGYFTSKEREDFTEALTVLRDKNSTEAQVAEARAKMEASLKNLKEYTENYQRRTLEAMQAMVAEGTLVNASSFTKEMIDSVLRLDVSRMGSEEKAALAERYEEYLAEVERLKGQYTKVEGFGDSELVRFDEKGFMEALAPVSNMYLDAITYNEVLRKKNDEWLQKLIEISRAADDAGRTIARLENQANQGVVTAETNLKARAKSAAAGAVVPLPTAPGLTTEMQGLGGPVGETLPDMLEIPVEPLNVYEKKLEEIKKRQEEVAETAGYAGQMFGAMGQLAAASGNEALAGVMNSFGAVADMIVQLQSLATAQGVASAAALPFPANLGAIATVLSTIASVWSSLSFAEGGIVPGSNYMDGITARVSSGEMVINTADQKRLYDAIHTGNLGGRGGGRMVVSGEQIVEVVNNYGGRTGKGRLMFKP
ncbi:MAG: hypothetical protein IJZ45_03920 [Bacteroidaceae bacterium]|nr:hypothetical protein [Bacteroidaceae bacterium]